MHLLSWDCAYKRLAPRPDRAGGRSPQSPAAGCPESPSPCWAQGRSWAWAAVKAALRAGAPAQMLVQVEAEDGTGGRVRAGGGDSLG